MEQREIQQTFIRSAIRVIAQKGLVKATTKAIAADAGLNEAYIYKCFKGKDELLAEALHDRDEGLAVFLRREFPNVLAETSPWRDRCFHLWEKTWKFILDKRDDCIFYLRYYSSPDFYAYEHDRQQQYIHYLTSCPSTVPIDHSQNGSYLLLYQYHGSDHLTLPLFHAALRPAPQRQNDRQAVYNRPSPRYFSFLYLNQTQNRPVIVPLQKLLPSSLRHLNS